MERIKLLLSQKLIKSHVPAHWRTLPNGKRILVRDYDDRRVARMASPISKQSLRVQQKQRDGLVPGKMPNQKAYPLTHRLWADKFKRGIPESVIHDIIKEHGGLLNILVQKYEHLWARGDEGLITKDDVWNAARLGAFNAILKYKAGYKFSTYLRYNVLTEIHNMIEMMHGRHFKLNFAESRAFRSFIKHLGKLTAELGRTPREDEFVSSWNLKKKFLHPDYPDSKEEVPDHGEYIHTEGGMSREASYSKKRGVLSKEVQQRIDRISKDTDTSLGLLKKQYLAGRRGRAGIEAERSQLKEELQSGVARYNRRLEKLKSPAKRSELIAERNEFSKEYKKAIDKLRIMTPSEYENERKLLEKRKERMIEAENRQHLSRLGEHSVNKAPGKDHYYKMFAGLMGTKFVSTSKEQTGEDESTYDHLFASDAPNPEEMHIAKESYREAWMRVQGQLAKMNAAARKKGYGPLGNVVKLVFHMGTFPKKATEYLEEKYGIADSKNLAKELKQKVAGINARLASAHGDAAQTEKLLKLRNKTIAGYEERVRSVRKTAYTDDTLPLTDVAVILGIPYKALAGESLRVGVSKNPEQQRARPGLYDRAMEMAKDFLSREDLATLRDTSYLLRGMGVSREEALVHKSLAQSQEKMREVLEYPSIYQYMMKKLGMEDFYHERCADRARRLAKKSSETQGTPSMSRVVNKSMRVVRVASWETFVNS